MPGSVDRKGPGTFARDRLIRLGLPLLAFVILLRPLASVVAWWRTPDRGDLLTYYIATIDPGPTWFLEVLLVFSLCYAAARALRGSVGRDRREQLTTRLRGPVVIMVVTSLTVIMIIAMTVWRIPVPDGTYWPIVGLPTPAFLPQYALLFVAGILAARRNWLTRLPGWSGWLGLALALVGAMVGGPLLIGTDPRLTALGSAVLASFVGVGLSLAILMLIRRVAPGTGRLHQYASARAFAVFVLHPVVLVWIALALSPIVAPAVIKCALLLIMALPVCFLLAGLLRRIPGASKVL